MTVPPLFGWQHILIALAIVLLVALVALVALAAGKSASGRAEWQTWLDVRSARRPEGQRQPGDSGL